MPHPENIAKVSRLIADLLTRLPLNLLSEAVIFGSSAIVLHGIDLGRPINDLDLFISDSAYAKLKDNPVCAEIAKKPGVYTLHVQGVEDVEILKCFPGVEHSLVFKQATKLPNACGLFVAALDDLRDWKQAQGRQKDLADLACMARHSGPWDLA